MIRVERDPAFWEAVAESIGLPGGDQLASACTSKTVLPLAGPRGGLIFARLDTCGFACEWHALWAPEAWGTREIATTALEALNAVFLCGFQVVLSHEVRDNPMSRPPLSLGFVRSGDWRESVLGDMRLWMLTRIAFENCAVNKRRRATCPWLS